MFARGWGVYGEAWKWRRRLFAWEKELLGECIIRLSNLFFSRLIVSINGFGSYMLLIVTLLVLLTIFNRVGA